MFNIGIGGAEQLFGVSAQLPDVLRVEAVLEVVSLGSHAEMAWLPLGQLLDEEAVARVTYF